MPESDHIREELERLVPDNSWPRAYPGGKAPEGYFRDLPERVLGAVSDQADVPDWGRKNPYAVPEEYFGRLPEQVLRRVTSPAPVVLLPRRRRHAGWSRMAVAAVITVLVALSGLLWFSPHPQNGSKGISVDQQIAALSSDAIEQYLSTETSTLNTDELLNTLNEDDLEEASPGALSPRQLEQSLTEEIPDSLY